MESGAINPPKSVDIGGIDPKLKRSQSEKFDRKLFHIYQQKSNIKKL